jgi:hypothetical protein
LIVSHVTPCRSKSRCVLTRCNDVELVCRRWRPRNAANAN